MQSEASGGTFVASVGDDCVVVRRNGQHARARVLSMRQEQVEVCCCCCVFSSLSVYRSVYWQCVVVWENKRNDKELTKEVMSVK